MCSQAVTNQPLEKGQTPLRKLALRSVIYAAGDLLTKFAKYLLVPIYLAVLQPAEIGVLAVLQATTMLSWAIGVLGGGAAVKRFYFGEDQSPNDKLVSTLWWFRLGISGLITTGLCFVIDRTGKSLFVDIPQQWLLIALVTGCFRGSLDIVESSYMIRERPMQYRTFTFSFFMLNSALVLLLVFGFRMELAGVVYGECIAAMLWCGVSGFLVTKRALPSISSVQWKKVGAYCLPLAPHFVLMLLLVMGDRLILQRYVSKTQLGIYEISYLYAATLGIMTQGLHAAWLPDFFRTAESTAGLKRYAGLADVVLLATFGAAIVLAHFSVDAIYLVAGEPYSSAPALARLILLGVIAQALFFLFKNPLLYQSQTRSMLLFSSVGFTLNVVVNLAFIDRFGIWASAYATVAAYLGMAFLVILMGRASLPIAWNWKRIWVMVVVTTFGVCAASYTPVEHSWPGFAGRCIGCLGCGVVLFAGFMSTKKSKLT